MSRRVAACNILICLLVLGVAYPMRPLTAEAQQQVPECSLCLEIASKLTLSSTVAPFTPSTTQSVAKTKPGEYLVSHLLRSTAIVFYDSRGNFLRIYDRKGQGPGEFTYSPSLHVGDSTIYASEEFRLFEFTENWQLLSTVRTDLRTDREHVLVLSTGEIAVPQSLQGEAGERYNVALLQPNGDLRRTVEPAERATDMATIMTRSSGGGFWTLSLAGEELRRYSPDGIQLASTNIQRGWFEPWRESVPGEGALTPPRPRNVGLMDLGDGTIVVITWVADPTWRPATGAPQGGVVLARMERNPRWDSVVQRIDTETGVVMSYRRVDEALRPVKGTIDELYSVRVDDLGHAVTEIWRVVH